MTLENSSSAVTFTSEETSAAVEKETQRILASNAERHGKRVSDFTLAQVEDARTAARQTVERQQALESNPLYASLEATRQKNAELEAQLAAVRAGQQTRSQQDAFSRESSGRITDAARTQARLGNEWYLMTQAQKFAAVGIDPQTVTPETKEHARRIFGRGADTAAAVDLSRANPGRYKQLKEVAQITGVYGG